MQIDTTFALERLRAPIEAFFRLSGDKIRDLQEHWDPAQGAPVFTQAGKYTTRGWTEWTQGFVYGAQLLQFDATGDETFLRMGRENTFRYMAPHVSHIGVHDHGFNNVSTYGILRRLAIEGRIDESADARAFFDLALKVSGAVQAARWTTIADGTGFIHSFNGPHSLFSDTIRSCRSLVLADALGHCLMGEGDRRISLRARAVEHIRNTLQFNVFFGAGRDAYDVRGRVTHEGIFNVKDGAYRCPSTQQGYSPFSTWTRGLAWVLLGCAEQLEFFAEDDEPDEAFLDQLVEGARATADFYIEHTTLDGIPFWDTGAPGLAVLG
ncbi:MAG TPA: glycosyl hydrolase, partial [Candidatus Hydrogenedentes bacterium]|nr:glycosyl hydrolase [Candidatus Hydrogenedentota bacterium]